MKFLVSRPAAGLFLDPGLGKTAIVLAAFKLLRNKGALKNGRMLVIAPLHCVYNVWPAEVRKWKEFSGLRVSILHGSKKAQALQEDADLYVINPEGLAWLSSNLRGWEVPSMLVVDESTKFKASNTQRFKLLKRFLARFQRRFILTGTPVPNGYLNLFGQIFILDLGEALGRFVTHYRNEYFTPAGFKGYDWKLLPGGKEEIEERIADKVLQMSSDDYLKLPKQVWTSISVDLPPKARKQYNTLEANFFVLFESGEITAFNAGAQSMKLRQMANGSVYDAMGRVHSIHTAKLDKLADLIEEIGSPTIVVYEFQHDLEQIRKKFPGAPTMSGTTGKKAQKLVEAWNRGEVPILCMHPASGGHGLNLQDGGNHMIFFGLSWDLEYHDQVVKRIHRPGQVRPCFYYQLIAADTMDEVVLDAQQAKGKTQKGFLESLKRYQKRRRTK